MELNTKFILNRDCKKKNILFISTEDNMFSNLLEDIYFQIAPILSGECPLDIQLIVEQQNS